VDDSLLLAYLESARTRLLQLSDPGESTWREVVERALGEAVGRQDGEGLARAVQFLVNLLEAQGRFRDAIAEIDAALALVGDDSTSALLAVKASMVIPGGDVEAALTLCQRAATLLSSDDGRSGQDRTRILIEVVRLQALATPNTGVLDRLLRTAASANVLDYLFGLSWLIPFRCAQGHALAVHPLNRTMRAVAAREGISFRLADVEVFGQWETLIASGGQALPRGDGAAFTANTLARWRSACLAVVDVVNRRAWHEAPAALGTLAANATALAADTGPFEHWRLFVEVSAGRLTSEATALHPPSSVTLVSLASALVGATVVAIAGSRAQAAVWARWLGDMRSQGVEMSLEFPLSARRVHALLLLRSGHGPAARRALLNTAIWCRSAGLPLESLLAEMQSIELAQRLQGGSPGSELRERARQTRDGLLDLGIDPLPHLYTVRAALAESESSSPRSLLTPRETDVLRKLAAGRTYKEAAHELGIAWQTVQTIAHHLYEKLGVGNRFEAVQEATRLSIL
jgi:DNA-binding CsgD family transcriptional regulator